MQWYRFSLLSPQLKGWAQGLFTWMFCLYQVRPGRIPWVVCGSGPAVQGPSIRVSWGEPQVSACLLGHTPAPLPPAFAWSLILFYIE